MFNGNTVRSVRLARLPGVFSTEHVPVLARFSPSTLWRPCRTGVVAGPMLPRIDTRPLSTASVEVFPAGGSGVALFWRSNHAVEHN